MHLLVLGGTQFLGRHVVEAALAREHRVTIFNRGLKAVPWPTVERLIGDRDGALSALAGRRFDAVVDTSGYVPRVVGASATLLADAVDHYTFVSTVSVYADFSRPGMDESGAVRTLADEADEDVGAHHGELKALCERAVEAAMPGRALHVRPGLIVGPCDGSGRFGYWVRRVADGGDVLAPGEPSRSVQFVDARDLAGWIVAMAETRRTGVFNATGPATACDMQTLLATIRAVVGGDARFTWVDDDFLVEQGVAPFTEVPLWVPPQDAGLLSLDVSKAIAAGLRCRSIEDTVRDTAAWLRASPPPAEGDLKNAGLSAARERELLALWRSRA